jgi:hypothetical protein
MAYQVPPLPNKPPLSSSGATKMSNLTPEQLKAIDNYEAKLFQIDDNELLRRHAVNNYRQNLTMHNTYHNIINHHLMIESEYIRSLTK